MFNKALLSKVINVFSLTICFAQTFSIKDELWTESESWFDFPPSNTFSEVAGIYHTVTSNDSLTIYGTISNECQ